MKKMAVLLVFILGISLTTNAQRGKKREFEKMTLAQKTELALKKMTLNLDLSPAQARKIKPLLLEKIKERKAIHTKRKALKKNNKKPSSNERYQMAMAQLDKKIEFKATMKSILNEKQYERFEKTMIRKKNKLKRSKRKKRY